MIDGNVTATEWANATPYQVTFGNFPATVRFEHDLTNLYVAVSVIDPNTLLTPALGVYFDNNGDGGKALGDDLWDDFGRLGRRGLLLEPGRDRRGEPLQLT